jgi:hypothetical protein
MPRIALARVLAYCDERSHQHVPLKEDAGQQVQPVTRLLRVTRSARTPVESGAA